MDKNALKGAIYNAGKSMGETAEAMGINVATLWRKANGETDFTRNEILTIRKFLGLSVEDADRIFFSE